MAVDTAQIDLSLDMHYSSKSETLEVRGSGLSSVRLGALLDSAPSVGRKGTKRMLSRGVGWATISAILLVIFLLNGGARAGPRGWKCNFSVTPVSIGPYARYSRTYFYSCYGRSLKETRRRTQRRCRRLYSCVTGACFPLDFRPQRRCEREP